MNKISWLPKWLAITLTFPISLTLLASILTIPEVLADPTINTGTAGLIGALIAITTPIILEGAALIFLIQYIKNYKQLQ